MDEGNPIAIYSYNAELAIQHYFSTVKSYENAKNLCEIIMWEIMIQRMLLKAKGILDNCIKVEYYSIENGLIAHFTSMAVIDYIESILGALSTGDSISYDIMSVANFGTPQKRMRFVLIGIKKSINNEVRLLIGSFFDSNTVK